MVMINSKRMIERAIDQTTIASIMLEIKKKKGFNMGKVLGSLPGLGL